MALVKDRLVGPKRLNLQWELELIKSRSGDKEFVLNTREFPFCTLCSTELERHQPDSERPDKILGTCLECGAWFLVDDDAAKVHLLPDLAWFEKNS